MDLEIHIGQRFRKSPKYIRAILILTTLAGLSLFLLFLSLMIYVKILGPPTIAVPQSSLYYSDSGKLIGETDIGQKRYWTGLSSISQNLIDATISVEDRKFYKHHGFDIKRIAGALIADLKALDKVQGASTITQQYARNLYLGHDKTWSRKAHEALYTLRLEMNYSKEEILEGYLNTIYYGHGVYGVKAASQFYYGVDPSKLSIAQASMLAGIPKGPSRYSPIANPQLAKDRQSHVLSSMVTQTYITEKERAQADKTELTLNGKYQIEKKSHAPFFQDAVNSALKTQLKIDNRTIEMGGLKVFTTLNVKQQEIAEKAFADILSKDSSIQAALITMEPSTGEVKALVGGRNYQESPFNRATQAVRQPGSTIKPLLYYSALESGFTPSTTLLSEPTTFTFDKGEPSYTPHNYNNQYANGELTLAQAIALSDNVYAVKTHLYLGKDALIKTARKFGITAKMAHVPSLALGTSGVRPIEMVNAYSILANGGKEVEPTFITKVENAKGEVIFESAPQEKQLLDPARTAVMNGMLTGVFDSKLNGYTKVTGSTILPEISRIYAGKSGSTSTDSWMIGYTPELVTGVWTGYDQTKKITNPTEKMYAKKLWIRFMEQSLKGEPVKSFPQPKDVINVAVDPISGKLSTDDCPVSRLTAFVKGTEPQEFCTQSNPEKTEKKVPKLDDKKAPWYKRFLKIWQ